MSKATYLGFVGILCVMNLSCDTGINEKHYVSELLSLADKEKDFFKLLQDYPKLKDSLREYRCFVELGQFELTEKFVSPAARSYVSESVGTDEARVLRSYFYQEKGTLISDDYAKLKVKVIELVSQRTLGPGEGFEHWILAPSSDEWILIKSPYFSDPNNQPDH